MTPEEWFIGHRGNILFIPGFSESWQDLLEIGNYLNKLGFSIITMNKFNSTFLGVKACSKKIRDYILENNLTDLVLVGHSKGGIISTFLLTDKSVNGKITKVISLSSPFKGTLWQKFRKLHISDISKLHLEKLLSADQKKKIINIYSKTDQQVIPHTSLVLEGAKNYEVDSLGHTSVIYSPKTKQIISNYI